MSRERPLTISVENEELVIRVGVATLASAFENHPYEPFCVYDPESGEFMCTKITNADRFADEVVIELQDEQEDGTTPVHTLLDTVALAVIENGSQWAYLPGEEVEE